MKFRRTGLTAAVAAAGLLLSACGGGGGGSFTGGGGGGGGTPTPTPTPTPSPTPSPVQALANQPPVSVYLAMLLTDGSVLVQADPNPGAGISAGDFYKLTPDINGDYSHGTWRKIASPPAGYSPWATNEAVLSDGRVLLAGGEYNHDEYQLPFKPSGLTNMSAVYNPVADQWTMIPAPAGMDYMGDPAGVTLPDGRYVIGDKLFKRMWAFDPATNQWSALNFTGYPAADFAEMGFTLLPSGAVISVDVRNAPQSYHFIPATGTWIIDAQTPVSLVETSNNPLTYGPAPQQVVGGVTYGPGPTGTYFPPGEIGPSILRPDGTVFWTGSANAGQTAHTAVYHPGATTAVAGSWTAGPDIPNGDDAGDASAALLVNGNVLLAAKSDALYEFNGTTLTRTVAPPASAFGVFLLPLPSGQVLVLSPGQTVRAGLYTPSGAPQAGWAPTITTVPSAITRGQTYSLTGTQLNGLSEAAAYGDEFNAATNYPLIRITNVATGHVFYARTHGHSMGVATGATPVTTMFDVPAGTETGASQLVVVANGIASAAVNVTVS
jgi:hypothetical protein